MGFLVGANGKFRDMRSHGAVGHFQHDVFAAAAALDPIFQRKAARVGDKVGIPDPARIGFALAAKIFRIAVETVGEIPRRVEDKVLMVKQVKDDRRAVDREKSRRLVARTVEVLIGAIERQREQATVVPFELGLDALVVPNRRRAASLENEMQIFVEMAHRVRFFAGGNLADVRAGGAFRAFHVDKRAAAAGARPRFEINFL